MPTNPRHRPVRRFPDASRQLVECPFTHCLHCGAPLAPRRPWHSRKTVQTLAGPLFVAGKSKECVNPACAQVGTRYYASQLLALSLPHSTYGLDVLAFIGWQFLYVAYSWAASGKTFGMAVFGIRVVRPDGTDASWRQAVSMQQSRRLAFPR